MITTDETKLATVYEALDQHEIYMEEEISPEAYERFSEAMLNLEDELAELDYEGRVNDNEETVVEFLNRLTQITIEYNKGTLNRPIGNIEE